jgi:hypothetical protein
MEDILEWLRARLRDVLQRLRDVLRPWFPPNIGRDPTQDERERHEAVFPRMKGARYKITGERDEFYNCWSYAVFCTACRQAYEPSHIYTQEKNAELERTLRDNGWTPSADCRRKKGVRKLALYCDMANPREREIIHAAKELVASDWWESKDGAAERFIHPTPESILPPEGQQYSGKFNYLCGCWEKPLTTIRDETRRLIEELDRRIRDNPSEKNKRCKEEAERLVTEIDERLRKEAGS